MSDTIQALNMIVALAAQRESDADGQPAPELVGLLENIAEVAGDALEDRVKPADRTKPRKQRVYKEIVRRVAAHFCDGCDTPEGAYATEEGVREILASYDIETVDFTGRTVKIV